MAKHWLGHGNVSMTGHVLSVVQARNQPTYPDEQMYAGVKACVAGAGTYLGYILVSQLNRKGIPVRALVDSTEPDAKMVCMHASHTNMHRKDSHEDSCQALFCPVCYVVNHSNRLPTITISSLLTT